MTFDPGGTPLEPGWAEWHGRHVVYVVSCADDIRYVGVTSQLPVRLAQHSAAPWWDEGLSVAWREYPDRVSAERAETEAIAALDPTENVRRGGPRVMRTLRLRRDADAALVAAAKERGISVNRAVEHVVREAYKEDFQ